MIRANTQKPCDLREPHRPSGSRIIRLAIVATLILGTAVTSELLGSHWWLFDLVNHFRIQIFWSLLVVLGTFGIARHGRGALLVVALTALQYWLCGPAVLHLRREPADRNAPLGATVCVMTLNVWARNRQYDRVIQLIEQESPDFVILEEIDEGWRKPLESLKNDWQHQTMVLDGGHFGIALLSRISPIKSRIERIDGHIPAIVAQFTIDDVPISLCGVHLTRPTSRAGALRQARQFDELMAHLSKQPAARIVVGDFNATPWTDSFAQFCEHSRLRSAREGFGVIPTWPTFLPGMLRIPIDHCLVTPEIEVRSLRLGPAVGSDHLPIIADLVVSPNRSS